MIQIDAWSFILCLWLFPSMKSSSHQLFHYLSDIKLLAFGVRAVTPEENKLKESFKKTKMIQESQAYWTWMRFNRLKKQFSTVGKCVQCLIQWILIPIKIQSTVWQKKIANQDLDNELCNVKSEHIKMGLDPSYNYCDFSHLLIFFTTAQKQISNIV